MYVESRSSRLDHACVGWQFRQESVLTLLIEAITCLGLSRWIQYYIISIPAGCTPLYIASHTKQCTSCMYRQARGASRNAKTLLHSPGGHSCSLISCIQVIEIHRMCGPYHEIQYLANDFCSKPYKPNKCRGWDTREAEAFYDEPRTWLFPKYVAMVTQRCKYSRFEEGMS